MPGPLTPAAPLVIGSDDGLLLFPSVKAARGYLEVPDVEAGVYGPAFDAEGRLLSVELPADRFEKKPDAGWRRLRWRVSPQFNPVDVRLLEEEPTHRSELIELLVAALGDPSPRASDLETLLALAIERYGIT